MYHTVVPPEVTKDVRLVDEPLQMVTDELLNVGVDGFAVTVIVEVAVLVHPLPSVPVTVYVLVAVGVAVTLAPIVDDRSVEGFQL